VWGHATHKQMRPFAYKIPILTGHPSAKRVNMSVEWQGVMIQELNLALKSIALSVKQETTVAGIKQMSPIATNYLMLIPTLLLMLAHFHFKLFVTHLLLL